MMGKHAIKWQVAIPVIPLLLKVLLNVKEELRLLVNGTVMRIVKPKKEMKRKCQLLRDRYSTNALVIVVNL